MVKLRIRFRRKESLRYLSHLDQLRMLHRAFRRASLPIAYSQGFNPHPILAFANAMSVGMTSDEEYFDVGLDLDLISESLAEEIKSRLSKVMPEGIGIDAVEILPDRAKSLTRLVEAADYEIFLKGFKPVNREAFSRALTAFNAKKEVLVQKRQKQRKPGKPPKMVEKDIRSSFDCLSFEERENGSQFTVMVRAVDHSLLKPETILTAFFEDAGYYLLNPEMKVHRKKLHLGEDMDG